MNLTNRLLYAAEKEGKRRDVLRLSIYKSLLFAEQNKMMESFKLLEEIFLLAEPDGYIRIFLDEGQALMKLLTQYVDTVQNHYYHRSKKVVLAYVKQLLLLMKHEMGLDATGLVGGADGPFNDLLTMQESTILKLIHDGLTNKSIARELDISLSTVKTHINNLYRKLGVNNRILAIQKAQQLNLL